MCCSLFLILLVYVVEKKLPTSRISYLDHSLPVVDLLKSKDISALDAHLLHLWYLVSILLLGRVDRGSVGVGILFAGVLYAFFDIFSWYEWFWFQMYKDCCKAGLQ